MIAQTKENFWWIGGHMGSSISNSTSLQEWAISEGVDDVPSRTSNFLIGFDIAHQRGRIPFQLSSAFDLPRLSGSVPNTFSFIFQSGYSWIYHPRFEVKTLGGIGFGYSIIRFRNTTPSSLEELPYNRSEAFARSGLFLYQLTAQMTYKPEWNNSRRLRPMIVGSIGFLGKLSQSLYTYGVNEQDLDGNYLVGEKVDIPKFFKGNTVLSIGIWLQFSSKTQTINK